MTEQAPLPYAVQYLNPQTGKSDYLDVNTGMPIPPALISQYQTATQEDVDSGKAKLSPGEQQNYQEIFQRTAGGDHTSGNFSGSTAGPREANNNYGYASKPGFLSIASAMPGPVGVVGKVANIAMNVNNGLAANKARESLGFAPKSMVGAAISDNKGHVGDITNGTESTPVGFEAQNSIGQTQYTPNEARMRQMVNPGTISETDSATINAQRKDFQAANPDAQKNMPASNMFSKMAANLFHPEPAETPAAVANPVGMATTADDTTEQGDIDTQGSSAISAENRQASGLGISNGWGVSTNGSEGNVHSFDKSQISDSARSMVDKMDSMGFGGVGVNSDRRSVASNAAVGGANRSQHLQGNAVDFSTSKMTDQQKEGTLDAGLVGGANGIGLYSGTGSMHLDTRTGPTSMWGVNGTYTGATVGQMPGWAREDLQAKEDAHGYSYLSSHAVATPTARPDTGFMGSAAISSGWGVTGGVTPTNSFSPTGSFASADSQTNGPSQVGSNTNSGPSQSASASSSGSSSTGGMGAGGRSDGSTSSSGGGFASSPGNSSTSDKSDKSDSGSGYGGSRSDGWN